MIIDVTGFGWSGSGAVHDLLREYDDVQFASYKEDWEFTFLWMVDGIKDLEHKLCEKHCRYADSDHAIQRFLLLAKALEVTPYMYYKEIFKGKFYEICTQYIKDLTQVEFIGRNFDEMLFPSFKEKVRKFCRSTLLARAIHKFFHIDIVGHFLVSQKHIIRLSYNPDNFIERTKQLMDDLFSYMHTGNDVNRPLITDQMFPPDCPELFFKYIDEPAKCIIVRRDPRDLYLLAKHTYSSAPLPSANVDDFIVFYKKTIEDTKVPDSDRILNVHFEDLIYNYEETKKKIENFVGIKSHVSQYKFFNPNHSINNTQLFNLYDDCNADVDKIKLQLKCSLYPFENFDRLGKDRERVF